MSSPYDVHKVGVNMPPGEGSGSEANGWKAQRRQIRDPQAWPLVELHFGLCLLRAYSACGYFRPKVILTPHGAAGQSAQHGDLANVGKGIGHRDLKQPLRRTGERDDGGKPRVEGLQRSKEASRSLRPSE